MPTHDCLRRTYSAQELGSLELYCARYLRASTGVHLPQAALYSPGMCHTPHSGGFPLSSMLPLDKRESMLYLVSCPAWGE